MTLRITWRRVLAVVGAAAALGLLVAWSGIVNIGASTGHAAITDWFLHWAMRNTVRTYAALSVEKLTLTDDVVSAAGHYAATCATCHGAPGEPASPVMAAMTPPAPDLASTASTWSDEQLFWIVKHGVKFTAMPAWPALGRDDEIARMTAFVRRLPELDPDEYRALAYGGGRVAGGVVADVDAAIADCDRCHADDGRAQPDIPVLAGQKPEYLARALARYAARERASGVMQAAAARLAPGLREAVARHYAGQPGGLRDTDVADLRAQAAREGVVVSRLRAEEAPGRSLERAAEVVASGLPERDLPACSECHAASTVERNPLLVGQKPAYIEARLRNWRGDPYVVDARKEDDTMPAIARRIPEELIAPLAALLGSAP